MYDELSEVRSNKSSVDSYERTKVFDFQQSSLHNDLQVQTRNFHIRGSKDIKHPIYFKNSQYMRQFVADKYMDLPTPLNSATTQNK